MDAREAVSHHHHHTTLTKLTPKKRWQETFLTELAACGIITDACKAAGVSRQAAYKARERSPTFVAAWDDAVDQAADVMEREAWRRAVEGVEKPVFGSLGGRSGSGEIGRVQEYSDTLLIFLLKGARPEKFRERIDTRHSGKDGAAIGVEFVDYRANLATTEDGPDPDRDASREG